MFIFPPFTKIFLKYALSKQTDVCLGDIGAADLLGTRKDNDKEQARLYRKVARRIQSSGLGGMQSSIHLALEVQRYRAKHSQDPQQEHELRKRLLAETERGNIAKIVDILFWEQGKSVVPHHGIEGMLDLFDHAEEIALKARQGVATNDDLCRVPWIHLGKRALPQRDEANEARIERLVSCDVLLFLWVLAVLSNQTVWKQSNIDHLIPDKYMDLGKVWIQELNCFAKSMRNVNEAQLSHPAPYKTIAAFLVSGDPDGGSLETLAEELSAIDRGKKRLTYRVIARHTQFVAEALKAHWIDEPDKQAMSDDLGNLLFVHGQVLGLLQYARAVALSQVQREYPSADIDAAFNSGLACWPRLVKSARV